MKYRTQTNEVVELKACDKIKHRCGKQTLTVRFQNPNFTIEVDAAGTNPDLAVVVAMLGLQEVKDAES